MMMKMSRWVTTWLLAEYSTSAILRLLMNSLSCEQRLVCSSKLILSWFLCTNNVKSSDIHLSLDLFYLTQNTFQCQPIVNTSTCPARIFPSPTHMLPTSPTSRRVGTTQRRKLRCWEPIIINTHQGWVQSSLNLQLSLFQLQRGAEGVLPFLRWRIYGHP